MKLRKVVRRKLSMILAVLLMVTSVCTSNDIVFAGSTDGAVDGTTVSTPVKGTSYYFNFQDKTSSIYAEDGTMNTGTFGLMTIDKAGKFHSEQHGMNGASQLTFQVAGNCTISIGGCQFSGATDQLTMTASAGALDATSKAAKTAKCYDANCIDGTDRVSFVYQGGKGTVTLVSPGSYIPEILITPLADDYESDVMMYADGTAISTLPVNTSYFVDFRKGDSALYTENKQDAAMNSGKIGLIEVVTAGKFHSEDHGMQANTKINLPVTGDCTIMVGGCRWGNTVTLTSETGTFDESSKSTVTTNCFKESNTDGSDRITFEYTGEAGTVTFASNTYIPYIQVTPVLVEKPQEPRKIEVWDFGAKQESDTALYNNHITADAWTETGVVGSDGTLDTTTNTSKEVTFGNLTVKYESGDKLYGAVNDLTFKTYSQTSYSDGYVSDGLWYCNGKGGNSKRCVFLNDVKAGDKIVAYLGSHTKEVDEVHFLYKGTEGAQDDKASIGESKCERYEFIAKYDGQYQIYVGTATNVKPVWHRIVQIPQVQVSGTVDTAETGITEYGVKFLNNTTLEETEGTVKNGTFTVSLTPGFTYTAVLTGNVGIGFTDACKEITVKDTDVVSGMTVNLTAEGKSVCQLQGTISGFAEDFDTSRLKVILKTSAESEKEDVVFAVDAEGHYDVSVEPNVSYTITLNGGNDYVVTGDATICLDKTTQRDIVVEKKPVYPVSGAFLGLAEETQISSMKFVNMEDDYEYPVILSGSNYSVLLRNGTYEVEAVVSGYQTISHVVVDSVAVSRDLLFTSTAKPAAKPLVSDIYVGYADKENNYATVREAVAACKAMNPTKESERVTVHIAPGTYREQVIVDTPYISFVNDEPDQEVLLTWYYGIGYEYYSIGSDGYYSEAAAFDKFDKNTAQKWGAATYIKSSAKAFRAENITFESSFNKYITEEELEDGVAPGGPDKKNYERTKDSDVASGAATERATALAVEGTESEFFHCKIVSSQDTLYTGNNIYSYFKNCFIDGNTDYIFGGGNILFDACQLSIYGYSDEQKGAYITAAADGSTTGYVFRNCYISANDAWEVAPTYLGRPWRSSATVTFIHTKLQSADTVVPAGWKDMSGVSPEDANYKEFNTTILGGEVADVSNRTSGTVQSSNPYAQVSDVLGSWLPVYCTEETANISFAEEPSIAGELKKDSVLTAKYSIGHNDSADASTIQWYRVTKDNEETLLKTALAYCDSTYTVTEEDNGCYIKLVVTPETISGTKSEAKTVQSELAVGEKPTEPSEPTEPDEKPTEPTQPSEKPTEPTQPSETPTEPTQPSETPTEPTQSGVTVEVNGSSADIVVPEGVIFKDMIGTILENIKIYLNVEKNGADYEKSAVEMKKAIEVQAKEIVEGKTVEFLEVNLEDEAGNKVTFTGNKINVIFEYPQGTGKDGYSYKVLHLGSEGLEVLTPELTDAGLVVQVSSFSPFALVYERIDTALPNDNSNVTVPDHNSSDVNAKADTVENETGVKTGDSTNALPTAGVMLIALMGILILAGNKKKKLQ